MFLSEKNITDIDLVTATQSLPYLPPKVFETTVRTLVDHLTANSGTLIAAPYATRLGGFSSIVFGMAGFDIRGEDNSVMKKVLSNSSGYFYDPQINISDGIRDIQSVIDTFIRKGALSQKEVSEYTRNFIPKTTRLYNAIARRPATLEQVVTQDENQTRHSLSRITSHLLISAQQHLFDTKFAKSRQVKEAALERIKQDYSGIADTVYGEHVISVTRRAA
jgi:hypothetical protein